MSLAEGSSLGIPLAFIAGLASFLSPCVLPLLPGYLSYMTGVSFESLERKEVATRRLLFAVGLFVLGFTTVFVALGLSATLLGSFLASNQVLLRRIGGAMIVLMGLVFMGIVPVPWLYRESRFEVKGGTAPRNYLMGLAFGFGWTPCIGPTLGATLTLAATEASPGRGGFLLFVYSMGLAIPFALSALGVSRLTRTMTWLKTRRAFIMRVAGSLLIAFGLLMLFDKVYWISSAIRKAMEAAGLDDLVGL